MSDEPEPPAHDVDGTAVEEPDAPGTDVVVAPPPQSAGVIIAGATPQEVLSTVGELSRDLKEFIDKQNLAASMGGSKKHVEIGGWQALGHLLGTLGGTPVHARTVWARPLASPAGEILRVSYRAEVVHYYPKAQGGGRKNVTTYDVEGIEAWEASVRVCTPDGTEVGRAEAMCSRYEAKWGTRDDYALRSQAETRAGSRAFRTALGWIVHAAGYSPTPHEEMPATPELPAFAQPATAEMVAKMGRALAYLLQDEESGPRVKVAIEKIMALLGELGAEEMPRVVTASTIVVAGAIRELHDAAMAAEAAPEPDTPPATEAQLEPTKDRGSVPTPRLSGDQDADFALMRERGCVCRDPLDPRTWRVDCPIRKHHENPDIPF